MRERRGCGARDRSPCATRPRAAGRRSSSIAFRSRPTGRARVRRAASAAGCWHALRAASRVTLTAIRMPRSVDVERAAALARRCIGTTLCSSSSRARLERSLTLVDRRWRRALQRRDRLHRERRRSLDPTPRRRTGRCMSRARRWIRFESCGAGASSKSFPSNVPSRAVHDMCVEFTCMRASASDWRCRVAAAPRRSGSFIGGWKVREWLRGGTPHRALTRYLSPR